MQDELFLRRKWTLKSHGEQVVFFKRSNEKTSHVVMKAFLWALYLPEYPGLQVEVPVGDRYKPDVVLLDDRQRPRFWGESGQVGQSKIRSLARRYRETHFAIAKWDIRLELLESTVQAALKGVRRQAPFDLLTFPADAADQFIDDSGEIRLRHADLTWKRLSPT